MPYRADLEAQRMRCDVLERELAELRLRAAALADAKRDLAAKEREVLAAQCLLAGMGVKRALPMLDSLRIASPCPASWDDMIGDERVRFCGSCAKNVYNLSAMSREEAEALLAAKEENLCARIFQRADGTVMTTDCPVGVRKKRVRKAAVAAVGGGLMAAGLLSVSTTRMGGVRHVAEARETTGEVAVAVMGDVASPPVPTPSVQDHAVRMGAVRARPNRAPKGP